MGRATRSRPLTDGYADTRPMTTHTVTLSSCFPRFYHLPFMQTVRILARIIALNFPRQIINMMILIFYQIVYVIEFIIDKRV